MIQVKTVFIRRPSSRLPSSAPRPQYLQPNFKIWACNSRVVLKLLDSHDRELTLGDLVEIWKQSVLDEAERPEPEPRDRTVTDSEVEGWAWTDRNWHEDVLEQWLEWATDSSNWTGICEEVYFPWWDSEGQEGTVVSLEFRVRFLSWNTTSTAGRRRW